MGLRDDSKEKNWYEAEHGFEVEPAMPKTKRDFSQLENDIYNELINIDNPIDQRRVLNSVHMMIEDYYVNRLEARQQDMGSAQKELELYRNGE